MAALIDLDLMKARLAEIDAEREPLLALIRAAEAYEGVVGKTLFASGGVVIRHRSRADLGAGRSAPIMAATEAAVAELLDLMGPLSTSQILDIVGSKPELNIPGKNPINVLSARLSNSEKFESKRGVGWWFKGRDWPPRFVPMLDDEDDDAADVDDFADHDKDGEESAL